MKNIRQGMEKEGLFHVGTTCIKPILIILILKLVLTYHIAFEDIHIEFTIYSIFTLTLAPCIPLGPAAPSLPCKYFTTIY
jgi:hypothetical protein